MKERPFVYICSPFRPISPSPKTELNGEKDGEMEEAVADPYRRVFNWYDGRMGENPLDAIERRETREEMLAEMTEKQREVFVLYYRDGLSQRQIAGMLGIDHRAVGFRLEGALKKAKKIF